MHERPNPASTWPLRRWAAASSAGPGVPLGAPQSPFSPGQLALLAGALFAFVWLGHLAAISVSPPVDDIEQLTWVRSLEWGYYKHPPLPTWLLWLPVRLWGLSPWTAYGAGAACTLGAAAIVWHLLARLRGATHATVAVLAGLCITFYNGRLHYYNHEVVLLLVNAASAALCWQAVATRRRRWWWALGLAIGLGALSKYQVAVTVACVLAFALHQRLWRDAVHRRGLLQAGLIALAIFTPHVVWLGAHDFGPLHYAAQSALGAQLGPGARALGALHWMADELLNRALPAWLLLAAAGAGARARDRPRAPHAQADHAASRALLMIWGLLPLAFMPLVGLSTGAEVKLHWGTPFLLFAVPAAMEWMPRVGWNHVDRRRLAAGFLALQALMLALHEVGFVLDRPTALEEHPATFDSPTRAERLARAARRELGGPIRIVSGDAALAGSLALKLPDAPQVLIDGRLDRSPWVTAARLRACGALRIGTPAQLPEGRNVDPGRPGLVWSVIAPAEPGAPCPP